MNTSVRIVAAGNTLAPALAEVVAAGYKVVVSANSTEWQANRGEVMLSADDPLSLLGLVRLYEARGKDWLPTDQEVEALLALDAVPEKQAFSERADVWEDSGTVHVLCVTSRGDPVELSESEASAFADQLALAIKAAQGE